jgi:uncharacterized protein (TIGR03545 family)
MNKWLRWQGALGFIAVTGLLLSIGWFFLDNWIHYAIESSGEDLVGAKVELDQVNTTLSPLGVELINLQVADPDEPFQNMVQIGNIRTHLDPLYLLMGQAIFDEAEILDVQFATERKTSGALPLSKKKQETLEEKSIVDEALKEAGIEPPSVDSILAKETLTTQTKVEALDALYQQCEKVAKEAQNTVPDKNRLKQYEDRLQAIVKGKIKSAEDFKQRKQNLKKLKAEIRSVKTQIEDSKDKLLACRSNFNKELKALRNAPKEDVKRLKEKYQFSDQGASNFARLLFGDSAEKWLDEALAWYEKLAPILLEGDSEEETIERSVGRNIHYPGINALPDFLIRTSKVSLILPYGEFVAEIKDITHQQDILGRPITLSMTGKELKEFDSFVLEGQFDRRIKGESKDSLQLMVEGLKASNIKLLSLKGNDIRLAEASAVLNAEATYYQNKLGVLNRMKFVDARFVGGGDKGIGKQLGLALASIKEFDLKASANGPLKDLDIDLKSNLDKKIGDAISARMKQKQKELEKKLERKINAQLAEYLQKNDIDSGKFNLDVNNLSASMDRNKKQLEDLLESEVADYEAQKKQELEDKKAAEKERLKKKADQELKDQLKSLKLKF